MMYKKFNNFLLFVLTIVPALHAQYTTLDWKWHDVGSVRQVITNWGWGGPFENVYKGIGTEYPAGSGINYGGRYIWIGGKRNPYLATVSTSNFGPGFEFMPTAEPWDSVWVVERGETADIPYWPDYTPISDQDFVCRYSDYNLLDGIYSKAYGLEPHTSPFYVDVIQTSHTWSLPSYDWVLFQYYIIPVKKDLQDIYISINQGFIQFKGIGKPQYSGSWRDDCSEFVPEKYLGIQRDTPEDPIDDGAVGPIGTLVFPPENIDPGSLKWTYKNYTFEEQRGIADDYLYEWMTSGKTDQPSCDDYIIMISFGPLDIALGDTLHLMAAEVFGRGEEGMLKNVERLKRLVELDYKVPHAPPRPPVRVEIANHQVTLRWDPQPGEVNPESYTDYARDDYPEESQPFEGYRVYKSIESIFGPWTLLAEFDLAGNDFYSNTRIQHHYTDLGLLNNIEYWYTVTAFSKPNPHTGFSSLESSLNKNAVTVLAGTAVPETVGKVVVVPNPYRGDINYNAYIPPWEKPEQGGRKRWAEQDRRIQFINVPCPSEIKIYTLAGDLIQTLQQNDPEHGFANWNLVSRIGQTIASGIYLFSCEDKKNGNIQVGKFVVIK